MSDKESWEYIVQQRTAQGWEDITAHATRAEAIAERKVYEKNQPEFPARVVRRLESEGDRGSVRTYHVTMLETIVLSTTVEAESPEEALTEALEQESYKEESQGTSGFEVYDVEAGKTVLAKE